MKAVTEEKIPRFENLQIFHPGAVHCTRADIPVGSLVFSRITQRFQGPPRLIPVSKNLKSLPILVRFLAVFF